MKIFYGSSSEYATVLDTLIRMIGVGDPLHWRNAFPNGRNFLDSLIDAAAHVDCAVFLMAREDRLQERGVDYMTPRDNLIFEAGIMIRSLGPNNVFLIYPDLGEQDRGADPDAAPMRPKHLSDLAGINHQRCAKIDPKGSVSHFETALADVPRRIQEELSRYRPPPDPHWIDGLFSIYNYLHTPDWHEAFRLALDRRTIEPKLMYYGPGLAKYWLRMTDDEFYRRKDELFERGIIDVIVRLLNQETKAPGVCVIDLGVGNGRLGRSVLSTINAHLAKDKRISYVGLDISQEMLISAVRDERMQACLRVIKQRGTAIGICGDFYQLGRIEKLLPKNDLRIFLLLGNTLGNERDEHALLTTICNAMAPNDVLLLEIQRPPTNVVHETRDVVSDEYTFDTGSFRCFGLLPQELEVREVIEPRDFGAENSFQVRCVQPRTLHHPAVAPLQLKDEWYDMMHVRKYNHASITSMLERVGMRAIIAKDVELNIDDETVPFEYIAAQKI